MKRKQDEESRRKVRRCRKNGRNTPELRGRRDGKGRWEEPAEILQGIFHRNPKGFGFVQVGDQEDVFVPMHGTGTAQTGDRVAVKITDREDARGFSGQITEILHRAHETCVGVGAEEDGVPGIRPLRRDLPEFIPYAEEETAIPKIGDWIEVKLLWEPAPVRAEISRKVPGKGGVEADLNAVALEYGVPRKYTATQERSAGNLVPEELPRVDFRKCQVFTCDPMDARDYDDALSLEPGSRKGTVVLGVHIADVACYVRPGNRLDQQAKERGFTTYFPGRTIGMLPDALAADLCSLREGEDRLAHSCFLTVEEKTGRVLQAKRCHTWIRSARRLCYEQVDRILEGETLAEVPASLAKILRHLDRVTAAMRSLRKAREEFLPLEIPEIRVLCAGSPARIVGLSHGRASRSGEMIEECMLAANVAVAEEMQKRGIGGLYRNHAAPDSERLEEFTRLASFALDGRRLNLRKRGRLVEFLETLHSEPAGEVLRMSLLRMMPRAEYGTRNQGHFGLGKELYCHFTSPIRRYPDLLVHQQLVAWDLKQPVPHDERGLRSLADGCNELEINTDQACFAAAERLKIRKMLQDAEAAAPGERPVYRAVVCRVMSAGMSIYLPENGLMGFLPVESLGNGPWHADERGVQLSNGRVTYRYGQTLQVFPMRGDVVRGEVKYRIFAPGEGKSRNTGKKRRKNQRG